MAKERLTKANTFNSYFCVTNKYIFIYFYNIRFI